MDKPFKPQTIAYCRVSTTDQVIDGSSLSVQENGCREFIARQGWNLVHEPWMEEGESAKTTDRTKLKEMMRWCEKNKGSVDHLVIFRITRLSRNMEDFIALKVFFRKLGITIVSVTEPVEDSPTGRFLENVLACHGQLENENRADQSKDGMMDGVRNGRWMWQAPLGYRNSGGRKISNLVINEPAAGSIRRAFELVGNGYTPQEVANKLKRDGFRTKVGKVVSVGHLGKILRKTEYKGIMDVYGKLWPGSYVPIVEAGLFDRVQAILEGRNRSQPKYLMQREDLPLRGFLRDSCGNLLTGSCSRGNGGDYLHYHCRHCKRVNPLASVVHAEFDGFLSQHALKPDFATLLKIAIEENMRLVTEDTEHKRIGLGRRIFGLQGEQDAIAQKNIAGVVDDDTARRLIAEKKKAIMGCERERALLPTASESVSEVVDYGLEKLQDPRTAWNGFSLAQKQRFQTILFPEGVTFEKGKCRTTKIALILQTKTALHEGELLLVTPRRAVMNFLQQADKLLPYVLAWNSDVSAFLKREPAQKTLAVTY